MGHTAGPWSIDPHNGDIVAGPLNVAILYACKPEDKAVMAAAPDLLEACQDALLRCSMSNSMREMLQNAITKAGCTAPVHQA